MAADLKTSLLLASAAALVIAAPLLLRDPGSAGDAVAQGRTDALPHCSELPASHSEIPGMVWVPAGGFSMGSNIAYSEEAPARPQQVAGFWMDRHEVSNRQFAEFVEATAYVTLAEKLPDDPVLAQQQGQPGSALFIPPDLAAGSFNGWHFMAGANWRQPQGPDSHIEGREDHPVVHVAYEDARAYAHWAGRALPTEAQFEYAAQGSARKDPDGKFSANTWQGFFPFEDDGLDGYSGSAPVGCFPPNERGLHDLIGNVWEWTSSTYYPSHDFAQREDYPDGFDPAQPGEAVAVIKGGSYLCSPNYCMRYRPEARQGHSKGLGTSHIGFRTVLNP